MLTIEKSDKLTFYNFQKNKGHIPFSAWRTVSKQINFGNLFGCSAPTFARMLKDANFTEEECEDLIKSSNNIQRYSIALNKNMGKMKPKDVKFLVAASIMQEAFFESYKGLKERIIREQNYALKNGFVRSWHGPVRHFPELRYMKITNKGEIAGADKRLFSKMFAHLMNNACNTSIQTMEARIVFATWVNIARYLYFWKLKSYCWNSVHDSLDFYIWKPELELVLSLANASASWEREPVYGIKMSIDAEVADVQDLEHRNNTYYKSGVEVKFPKIEDALKNYNKKYETNLKYYGCDFYDEFDIVAQQKFNDYCKQYNDDPNDIKRQFGIKVSSNNKRIIK